jgi:chromosomal replication initiator protein
MTNAYTTRFTHGGAGGKRSTAAPAVAPGLDDGGPRGLWRRVKAALRARFDDTTYSNWIAGLEYVAEVDGEVLISAPGEFECERVCSAHGNAIRQAWKSADALGRPLRIEARSAISAEILDLSDSAARACEATPAIAQEKLARADEGAEIAPATVGLHGGVRSISLDQFVVGESNRVAYNLARRVAAGSNTAQLATIVGPHGVGKTMLLRGIEAAVAAASGPDSVLYVSAEDFLVAFVEGVRRKDTSDLRAMMRSAKVVLMDDFHFICSKPGTLVEFFTHLRANVARGHTVVIASDQPLTQLEQLDSRMRDELMGGVVVAIDPPERGLRLEILRSAARALAETDPRFTVPDDWLERVADQAATSGRVLCGVVSSVYFATIDAGLPLTWDAFETELRQKVGVVGGRAPKIDTIKETSARTYNVTKLDLESECRKRIYALPRQYAMYMCRKLTKCSYPMIGRHFGDRDHTTVLFAFRKVSRLVAADPVFAEEMRQLEHRILADPRNQR